MRIHGHGHRCQARAVQDVEAAEDARILDRHFDSETPWADEAIRDLLQRLPECDGYHTELFVAREERRLLESGPGGLTVLGREPLSQPLTITALLSGTTPEEPLA
ncbi:cytoplasmic protein [Pseudomonas aeruginosa]|uniref:cytoplasmic protein n=1 Tax=Pseudomonas aeruginosa TaxID=287 RepID=UPI0020177DED|nr:cytoplasmic protein [Pseudomonas aeruginosa]